MKPTFERLEDRNSPTNLIGTVFLTGGPPYQGIPPPPVPYANAALKVESAGGLVAAVVMTDKNGKFHVNLPPGSYQLVAVPYGRIPQSDPFTVPATVGSNLLNGSVKMNFDFFSGIL